MNLDDTSKSLQETFPLGLSVGVAGIWRPDLELLLSYFSRKYSLKSSPTSDYAFWQSRDVILSSFKTRGCTQRFREDHGFY